jgi:hypothetical protein
VFKQGVCKPEFEAFDRCFDTATAAGADGERRCQGLFTSFRTCFDKRSEHQAPPWSPSRCTHRPRHRLRQTRRRSASGTTHGQAADLLPVPPPPPPLCSAR